jgi:fructuronate reductase
VSALPRLGAATLAHVPGAVRVPGYDRRRLATRVVHLGPGAFHRAHQAIYFDDLNHLDPRWGVAAVALRSPDVPRALAPQDGLYALASLGGGESVRIVGTHTKLVHAVSEPARAFAALTDPNVRVVTLTVTEKGYCLGPDGRLDFEHRDIQQDLATPETPTSAIGWLVEALRRRRAAGAEPFHVLCCDNLPANGTTLAAAVIALAGTHDHDLALWIADEVRFPSGVVDAITPATDDALRGRVDAALGLHDAWPVQREAFSSWVIEACDAPGLPDLAAVGAVVTTDVTAHEQAKLRLLNGAHSCLAYLGLAHGHETVAEAMADTGLAAWLERLMDDEIAPSLGPAPGLDPGAYAARVRARFANPAIRHELAQIAWDGSQKLPIRLLPAIADNLRSGRPVSLLSLGVAGWMRFVRRRARAGVAIVDPKADLLGRLGAACADVAEADVAGFLELSGVFPPELARAPGLRTALERGYDDLMRRERGTRAPFVVETAGGKRAAQGS